MINKNDKIMSIREQCKLLDINRSTLYYHPVGDSEETLAMMNLLDEQYTRTPFYGVPKMTKFLRDKGYKVGRDRVRTLLRKMGLYAIYPKPYTSTSNKEHKVYPYLLKDLAVTRPNQVWAADITYIRLLHGFAYLVAVIDWFSRYVLSWRLSNSLEANFCIEALEEALDYGKPDIFNSDQGSQFTSSDFVGLLTSRQINISMDSRGRAFDNIFVERLWRSVKYEDIYIKDYQTISEVTSGLRDYFLFFNNERYHQTLDYGRPTDVYYGHGVVSQKFTKKEKIKKKRFSTAGTSFLSKKLNGPKLHLITP